MLIYTSMADGTARRGMTTGADSGDRWAAWRALRFAWVAVAVRARSTGDRRCERAGDHRARRSQGAQLPACGSVASVGESVLEPGKGPGPVKQLGHAARIPRRARDDVEHELPVLLGSGREPANTPPATRAGSTPGSKTSRTTAAACRTPTPSSRSTKTPQANSPTTTRTSAGRSRHEPLSRRTAAPQATDLPHRRTDARRARELRRSAQTAHRTSSTSTSCSRRPASRAAPKRREECSDGSAHPSYCAYHSYVNVAKTVIDLRRQPVRERPQLRLRGEEHPNGVADAAIGGGLAHEHSESVTDPEINAWHDSKEREVGGQVPHVQRTQRIRRTARQSARRGEATTR